ncbi:Creatine kinase S-type, mitochondrial [Perkinsus chesapeaki]|uniref:Creatine kinase S-type, mitochondrial n=1 Tax=Perkinsus chesapeaki TaxID=330153 RepID=A0A7J6KWS7_PERCH|nr:Creatine kinase S-type, mitochondrial [Perkinsus chesapeaki]
MAGRHFHRAFRQADVLTPLIGGIGLVAGAGVLWQLTRPEYPPYKLAARLKSLPASIRNGLGDDEYYCEETNATFPADKTPGKLPDLSKHGNLLARVLKEKPSLYKYFREKITSNGVTLAKCIKPGIDNPGSEEGIIAGDEESYETFKELFDIVIDRLHRGYPAHARHNNDLDPYKITRTRIDTSGKYVLSCSVSAVRSIRGFNLPPSISFLDRRSVEKLATEAVGDLKGDLEGQLKWFHRKQIPPLVLLRARNRSCTQKAVEESHPMKLLLVVHRLLALVELVSMEEMTNS